MTLKTAAEVFFGRKKFLFLIRWKKYSFFKKVHILPFTEKKICQAQANYWFTKQTFTRLIVAHLTLWSLKILSPIMKRKKKLYTRKNTEGFSTYVSLAQIRVSLSREILTITEDFFRMVFFIARPQYIFQRRVKRRRNDI